VTVVDAEMYETILVPTDGSEGALAAADHAIDVAGRYGATVHALFVADTRMSPISSGMDREDLFDLLEGAGGNPTAPVIERAEAAGVAAVEHVEAGVPYRVIRRYVEDNDVDLVVMGTHGRTGLEHALLGSLTERAVRTLGVPVLAVPIDGARERAETGDGDTGDKSGVEDGTAT